MSMKIQAKIVISITALVILSLLAIFSFTQPNVIKTVSEEKTISSLSQTQIISNSSFSFFVLGNYGDNSDPSNFYNTILYKIK